MPDATFDAPDLTTFCRLDELGLEAVGQRLEPDRAVIECRVVEPDEWCRNCGAQGAVRDTVTRRLAHEPFGRRPTMLLVRVRRYRCAGCGRVWRQDTSKAAEPRSKLSRGGLAWALVGIVVQHLTVARLAEGLGVGWHTANTAVLDEGRRVLVSDPVRFEGVRVIGVDEHAWRHTRLGDRYVTVVIDLTPVRDRTGPAPLLDMVAGRSKQVFATWLEQQTPAFRDGVQVVAMDGFTGFKTTAEALPDAVEVMDPFHVVQLAGDALDRWRQRVQHDTLGHRGHAGDPLFGIRRILHTGEPMLTDRQRARIDAALASDQHVQVEVTWAVYQRIVAAYRDPDRRAGRRQLRAVIDSLRRSVPAALTELRRLGRTLARRAGDVLAYFDLPGTSNGPTEAINGRLEHLRGSALGFRNLTNYIARSLLETGGFRPALHPRLR
ncbi:ISL3 family transposase [Cellulomonas hominis]